MIGAVLLAASAAAEELRWANGNLISGEARTEKGGVKVSWPFGSVTVPAAAVRSGPTVSPPEKAPLRAWTRGDFILTYALERKDGLFRPRRLQVRVANHVEYREGPTARLREHEDMHRRINLSGAARLERELAAFRARAADPAEAEEFLLRRFQEGVREIKALHGAWDANHGVP